LAKILEDRKFCLEISGPKWSFVNFRCTGRFSLTSLMDDPALSSLLDLLTQKVSRVSPLAMKISTKFDVHTTIHCLRLVIVFFAADTLRDLVTLTFDLGQWSYMTDRVINPSAKFEAPTAI